ncbi:hypothetical protein D4764_17G0000570 [Takifugu flavidus]|uniref:Uncharacterized protein n=1 Tax=Takifugu flavidus TaxID=433684 RepID=A0A5C6NSW7_9TELE|nr:hypothetical protein D4764_17G0000570 [Takifugu flavidus]
MGGLVCKDEVTEEKRSVGMEDSLASAERIRRITFTQFGSTILILARRGLQVGPAANLSIHNRCVKATRDRNFLMSCVSCWSWRS